MDMTYKELLNIIKTFSKDRLNQSVSIYHKDSDEYYPLSKEYEITEDNNDVLDKGSIVFSI